MQKYTLHAGLTIPNFDDKRDITIEEGLYAIEPFATNGNGKVHDGKPSGIYSLQDEKKPRSEIAREILTHIIEEYKTLPFCSRWIHKKFGAKTNFGLRMLENNGNIHNYAQLVEKDGSSVAQSENTIIVEDTVTVTTE
jgi:methionyl aminopeptidase